MIRSTFKSLWSRTNQPPCTQMIKFELQAQSPQERPTPPTTGQFVKNFVIVANLPYRECRISKASLPPLLSETPQNKNIIL